MFWNSDKSIPLVRLLVFYLWGLFLLNEQRKGHFDAPEHRRDKVKRFWRSKPRVCIFFL